jgi:hypothetical protein
MLHPIGSGQFRLRDGTQLRREFDHVRSHRLSRGRPQRPNKGNGDPMFRIRSGSGPALGPSPFGGWMATEACSLPSKWRVVTQAQRTTSVRVDWRSHGRRGRTADPTEAESQTDACAHAHTQRQTAESTAIAVLVITNWRTVACDPLTSGSSRGCRTYSLAMPCGDEAGLERGLPDLKADAFSNLVMRICLKFAGFWSEGTETATRH